MVVCPDCFANLDHVAVDEPCPACGGTRRSTRAVSDSVVGVSEEVAPTGAVSWSRPWHEKWHVVLERLDDLREMYETDARKLGMDEVGDRVHRFFRECHAVKDWLITDMANIPDAVRPAVSKHSRDDPDLEIGSAVANPQSQMRRGARAVSARIADTHLTKEGAHVLIRYESLAKGTKYCDALALAEKCVQSWRDMFELHGIVEP
jgi:hypothetical protein